MRMKSIIKKLIFAVSLAGLSSAASHSANAAWKVEKADGGSAGCIMKSTTQKMQDGYRTISVHAEINGMDLTVVTPSNIDTGFSDIRIQVDRKAPITSYTLVGKQSVRFAISPQAIGAMRKGKVLNAYLRFWPTWPVTRAYRVSFSLNGFSSAMKAAKNCS